jgi:hypothetical protein
MEIKITKSSAVCQLSGRPFVHDEEYTSVLRVRDGELVREDYAKDHWQDEFRKGSYSVWSTRFYDPKVAEQESPEVFSPLRQLFYEAVESEERVEQAKAFLAAQLLRRQKAFRLVKESDETETEVRVSLYADRIGNRLIQVRDPSFSYVEMEQGRQRLLARLQELERPEGAPVPEVAADGQLALLEVPEESIPDEGNVDAVSDALDATVRLNGTDEVANEDEDEEVFDDDEAFEEGKDEGDGDEDAEGDDAGQHGMEASGVLAEVESEADATTVAQSQAMDAEAADADSSEEMYEAKPIHS